DSSPSTLEPPSSLLPAKSRPEIARASIVLPRPVSRAACPSECVVMCSKGSRGAPRDPSRDGAHEIVNEWCNDGLPEPELGQEKPTKRAELHRRRARPHSKPSASEFSPRHGRPLR